MKVPMLLRQIQEVPAANREKQKELEHRSDLAALRIGMPLPTRYTPFSGNLNENTRIHEREFESVGDLTRLMAAWLEDSECQQIDEEWKSCYSWEKREIYYADDPENNPTMPWLQMAAEQGRTVRYVVNPDYQMPKDQKNYKG